MGIYKTESVYGKNDKNERVYIGLKVNGIFYKGIRKTSEIPKGTTVSKPKTTVTVPATKKRTLFSKKS